MGKQKKATIGSWMTKERLEQKHHELEEELRVAAQQRPVNTATVAKLKKQKLLCKDLLEEKKVVPAVALPSAEVIPFSGRDVPASSLFLGTPRLIASGR